MEPIHVKEVLVFSLSKTKEMEAYSMPLKVS